MSAEQYRAVMVGVSVAAFGAIIGIYYMSQRRSDAKWDKARDDLTSSYKEAVTPPEAEDFREVNG